MNFATQKRIPSMFDRPYLVKAGGLMSYGADEEEQWRRAAVMADKVLKGAKPAELPMKQPTKFNFVLNLKTAKTFSVALCLTLSQVLTRHGCQVVLLVIGELAFPQVLLLLWPPRTRGEGA